MKFSRIFRFLLLVLGLTVGLSAVGQRRKIQNKPFIDTRRWHYGFNIGFHDQGLHLVGNGYTDEAGNQWVSECDRQNIGLSVGVLGSLKLNNYLELRFNPGLSFGAKHIQFVNLLDGKTDSQDMKSTYIGIPIDMKFCAKRYNNYRPYALAGFLMQYDLTSTKHTKLRTKPFQTALEVGLGCDLYMPFFKLIPEVKFSFGLGNVLKKNRNDLTDPSQLIFTQSVSSATSNMVTINLYFE